MWGGGTVPKTMNAAGFLSAVVAPVYIGLHPESKLPCSNDFTGKQGILKLMMGALHPLYYLPGNVISAAVDLVYINVQPEHELLA